MMLCMSATKSDSLTPLFLNVMEVLKYAVNVHTIHRNRLVKIASLLFALPVQSYCILFPVPAFAIKFKLSLDHGSSAKHRKRREREFV